MGSIAIGTGYTKVGAEIRIGHAQIITVGHGRHARRKAIRECYAESELLLDLPQFQVRLNGPDVDSRSVTGRGIVNAAHRIDVVPPMLRRACHERDEVWLCWLVHSAWRATRSCPRQRRRSRRAVASSLTAGDIAPAPHGTRRYLLVDPVEQGFMFRDFVFVGTNHEKRSMDKIDLG